MAFTLLGLFVWAVIATCILYWVLRDIGDQLRKIAEAQSKE